MTNVLVTGASRGIGYELVLKLLKDGCQVTAVSRNSDGLDALIKAARNDGEKGNLKVIKADITNNEDLELINDYIENELTHLNALVNNAGLLINKPIKELTSNDFDEIYNTNVKAPFCLIKLLINSLCKASWAHIVNISSVGGVNGSSKFPGLSLYSSSKGALNILGEVLAEELVSENIKVNNLALGAVQTEMLEQAFQVMRRQLKRNQWLIIFLILF